MKRYAASVFCLLATAFQTCGAADAVFQQVKGKVLVRTGGAAAYEAKTGDPLYFGDEIKTGAAALAHVSFPAGATVLVKENSDFSLKGNRADVSLAFRVGEFLIGLKQKLAPGKSFKVKTPAAVAAVRGTLFWGKSDENKDSTYACLSSSIEITAQGKSLTLNPGQTVKIPFGKGPEAPQPSAIPEGFVNTFAVDGSLQGLEKLVEEGKK